jgi:type I restriction enzyme S subunit
MGNENVLNGKYTDYPEYKDTGITWLPSIPENWQVLPLKLVLASKVKDGPHETPKFLDEGIPFFSVDGIQGCKLVFEGCRYISQEDHDRFSMKCLPKFGDVLLGKAASVGKVAFVDTKEEFNVWSPLAVLTPKSVKLGKFIFYSLQSTWLQAQCDVNSNSNTQKNLSMGVIDNLSFAIPSDAVADKIACFLDHETAKIDTLIDKQKQLIKLLKEKRQAVISHAVTKGLNPDAPMRDSGVEWLGEVPEHWIVTKAKFLYDFVTSGSRGWADYYSDNGPLFFRIANLTRDTIEPKLESIQCVTPPLGSEGVRAKIKKNDLLISITADLGSVCVANEEVEGGYVSQHVALCRPNKKVISPRWLGYCILSDLSKEQLLGSGYGGTKIQLSLEDIRELCIVLPSQAEQTEIEEFIDLKLIKFSKLMKKANGQVLLLQERRAALISAAVTGKIDVRSWYAPKLATQGAIND